MMQMPINIPGTRYHKAVEESNAIRKQFTTWINERRRAIEAGSVAEHPDILSGVLAYMEKQGTPLSDKEVKDNVLFLLFANYDAATVVATMTCKYLASDPHIMDEVYRGLFATLEKSYDLCMGVLLNALGVLKEQGYGGKQGPR